MSVCVGTERRTCGAVRLRFPFFHRQHVRVDTPSRNHEKPGRKPAGKRAVFRIFWWFHCLQSAELGKDVGGEFNLNALRNIWPCKSFRTVFMPSHTSSAAKTRVIRVSQLFCSSAIVKMARTVKG